MILKTNYFSGKKKGNFFKKQQLSLKDIHGVQTFSPQKPRTFNTKKKKMIKIHRKMKNIKKISDV